MPPALFSDLSSDEARIKPIRYAVSGRPSLCAATLTLLTAPAFLCVLVVCVRGSEEPKASKPNDLQSFQGRWKIESLSANGKRLPLGLAGIDLSKFDLVIKGDSWLSISDDENHPKKLYSIELFADRNPKEMNLVDHASGETLRGIYEVKKQTLKICLCADRSLGVRPRSFSSSQNEPYMLMEYSRRVDEKSQGGR
ncbi:TIGR03067 domain-containing protein [Aquisphaera giovannonii]|uniref:TIGR03067 domain-containing protein n=1 Tax=Aquisphaera giovannonii TaxID=406548 RepID=UPI0011DFBF52|nr:TIGR03067 domain-containing protein [Aquisphaera giovannonii]